MRQGYSPRESSRVFIGGIAAAAITFAWWNGYLFRPVAEPVAAAISGDQVVGSFTGGKTGDSATGDLLASILTGFLYCLGQFVVWLFTFGGAFASRVFKQLLKWILSWTESGREFVHYWEQDEEASKTKPRDPEQELVEIKECCQSLSARLSKAESRLSNAESQLGKMTVVVNNNHAVRKMLTASTSYKAFRTTLDSRIAKTEEASDV